MVSPPEVIGKIPGRCTASESSSQTLLTFYLQRVVTWLLCFSLSYMKALIHVCHLHATEIRRHVLQDDTGDVEMVSQSPVLTGSPRDQMFTGH